MILKLAWKNIWRNKLRSLVMLAAIAIGLMVAIMIIAFNQGIANQKVADVIDTEMTHLQINRQPFIDNGDVENCFNSSELEENIGKIENVVGVSPRIKMSVMVSSAYKVGGTTMIGIDPEKEKEVSLLYKSIADSMGTYFEGSKKNNIVVGAEMAEKYKIKLRSKIVLSFADINGNQVAGAFRVCGIFKTNNMIFEESVVFVKTEDIRELTGISQAVSHELSIKLSDHSNETLAMVKTEVEPLLTGDEKLRTWKEISSMMALYTDFIGMYTYIIVGIILFALGFGIVNIVLMSVMERRQEISMLIAVGMNKRRVLTLITLEGTILTLVGGFAGMLIGVVSVEIASSIGIDMSKMVGSVEGMGFSSIVYPVITINEIVPITIMIIIAGILSAIYPARKAVKINPADGIK